MRYGPLMKRLDRLTPKPVRPDNDDDGFLTAVGALPGESAMDALERIHHRDRSQRCETLWFGLLRSR